MSDHNNQQPPGSEDQQLDRLLDSLLDDSRLDDRPPTDSQQLLAQAILTALPKQAQSTTPAASAVVSLPTWLNSPVRALAASAAPLFLGLLLGTSGAIPDWFEGNIASYPESDELLFMANFDSSAEAELEFGPQPDDAASQTNPQSAEGSNQ